jgi:ribosomal protein L22
VRSTDGLPSPERFRKWAAIWVVGSVGRRQLWTQLVPKRPIYPNIFAFLVGPPGTGKTEAIVPAVEHLRKSDTAKIAPNDVTKQSLLDRLAKSASAVTFEGPPAEIIDYHFMAVGIRELSNFMSQYDRDLAGVLTDLFDNPPVNDETKRSGAGAVIVRPGLSLLAGTATKNLGHTIGSDLWGQGFMSRVILVYSAEQADLTFFEDEEGEEAHSSDTVRLDTSLVRKLVRIGQMKGRVRWEKDAQVIFNEWKQKGYQPAPSHAKLVEYCARRFLHVAKLALISAMSRVSMTINGDDMRRALEWLEDAERQMPEIFKEMTVHSDGEVARELHMHCYALYLMNKHWIPYSTMASFLMTKVATRDIKRIIENAEEAGMFDRKAGTSGTSALYKPRFDGQMKDLPE